MGVARDPKGRFKDVNWHLSNSLGEVACLDHCVMAILMDIRDELKSLNSTLQCKNFLEIPATLRSISRNTKREKKA